MLDQGERFAARLRKEAGDAVPDQVRRAFRLAFGRDPSEGEAKASEKLVRAHGLATFCRALFNANEFVFVDWNKVSGAATVRERVGPGTSPRSLTVAALFRFSCGRRDVTMPRTDNGVTPAVPSSAGKVAPAVRGRREAAPKGTAHVPHPHSRRWSNAARRVAALSSAASENVKRLRVLVVEDSRDAAVSLRMVLEMFGHEVRVAHSGPDGVREAEAWRPDVVLSDIGLPGFDGYEVARRIRRIPGLERAVLAALTGYGTDDDRRRGEEAGFDHHLVKPADPDDLRRVLASRAGRPSRKRERRLGSVAHASGSDSPTASATLRHSRIICRNADGVSAW